MKWWIVAVGCLAMAACSQGGDRDATARRQAVIDARFSGPAAPSADFFDRCLMTEMVPFQHASVRDYLSVMSLKPSAKASWEAVAPASYILRIINNDPMTHEQTDIAVLFDPSDTSLNDKACGPKSVIASRLTVDKSDVPSSQIYELMIGLVDSEKLAALAKSRETPTTVNASTPAAVGSAVTAGTVTNTSSEEDGNAEAETVIEGRESSTYKECMSGSINPGQMNGCARDELTRQDAGLNGAYKAAMSNRDDSAKVLLRSQQREWIKMRDTSCDTSDYECVLDATILRTIELEKLAR
jgi:uncharacterized protein YecT (DUF1311 family)